MRTYIIILLLFPAVLFGQSIVKNAALTYTAGTPTHTPDVSRGSEYCIDTTTMKVYWRNRTTASWVLLGQGIDVVVGGSAPVYVPSKNQSVFAVSTISGGDSLYYYRSGVWHHINKGGGGSSDSTWVNLPGGILSTYTPADKVTIGTTSAHTSTTMLTVKGQSNDNSFGFAVTNTGSTPSLLVGNSGKVRINGTSGSSYNLHVTGTAYFEATSTDYVFINGGASTALFAGTPLINWQSTTVNTSGGRTDFFADFTGSVFALHPSSGASGANVKVNIRNKANDWGWQTDLVNNRVGIGVGTLVGSVDLSAGSGGLNMPRWTTAQRSTGTGSNFLAYNTDSLKYEGKIRNTTSTYGALVLTPSYSPTSGQVLKHNGTDWVAGTDNNSGGTVTSITTGTGLTGGPITTAGTISVASGGISATELATDAVTNTKIANNAVNTAEIVDAAVTAAKINSMSATSEQFLKYNGSAWAPDSIGYNALKYALKFYLDSLRTNNIYFQSDSIRDDTRNVRMDGDGTQVLQVGNFPADDLFDADGYGLRVQKGYSGLSTNTDSHYSVLDLGGTYAALSHGTYSNIAGNVSAEFYAGGVFRNQLLSANSQMVKNSGNLIRGRFLAAQQNTSLNTYFLAEETVSGSGTQRHYSGYSGSIDTVTGKANAYISAGFRMDTSARRHSLWLGVGSNPTAGLDTCFVFYTDRGLSINQMLTLRSSWDFSNSSIKFFDKYYVPNATPSTTSGVKQAMVWTGNGTTATPAFETVGNSAHTIQTTTTGGSTTTMAHRTNLDFVDNSGQTGIDFTLTDDNVNGKTKVQATIPNVYAGTYTPTETHSSSTATISSVTVRDAHYIRVGFEVHVTGSLTITSTATGSVVSEITLPIASNFTASADCFGTAVRTKASTTAFAQPYADANSTSDKIRFTYQVGSGTEDTDLQFSVIYTIK